MVRSPGFGSMATYLYALLTLGFPSATYFRILNLASNHNSLDRSTKSTRSRYNTSFGVCKQRVSGSLSLPFRGSFHLSITVLVRYRSPLVFRLRGWSPHVQTGFHVSRPTLDTASQSEDFVYWTITIYGVLFQNTLTIQDCTVYAVRTPYPKARFGLYPLRSPLLRISSFLSFPAAT